MGNTTQQQRRRLPWRALGAALTAAMAAALTAGAAGAQGTDATIIGQVRSADGPPVEGALVVVRNGATGFQLQQQTRPNGEFVFPQLPLGGPYTVLAWRLGFRPETKQGYQLDQGDRIRVEFALAASASELEAVVVTAEENTGARKERLGASTKIGSGEIRTLPTVNRNFTGLVTLAPTVANGLNLGGNRTTAVDVRIDGVQARSQLGGREVGRGPFSLSMEAIREFEIVTNAYDVTQGRGGGGAVSAVTKTGYHRNESLSAARDFAGRDRALREQRITQWGGSVGGPIVRDQMHYFFAFDRQDQQEPFYVLDLRTPQDEIEQGIARDSVSRLLTILQNGYGMDAGARAVGASFVCDPADPSTPPEVAAALGRVLENPENVARDYPRDRLGQIAERNAVRAPWVQRLDVRLARAFPTLRGQQAELTVDVFNFANLLNNEWGARQLAGGTQTLYDVTGFDQATRRYCYRVNENVGVLRREQGDPYQIQAGVRYAF